MGKNAGGRKQAKMTFIHDVATRNKICGSCTKEKSPLIHQDVLAKYFSQCRYSDEGETLKPFMLLQTNEQQELQFFHYFERNITSTRISSFCDALARHLSHHTKQS